MSDESYDIIILGGGSAGLTGADFAAKLGARVAIVEKHRIGGDCTWTGCVPSKALLKAGKIAHDARRAAAFGVDVGPPRVDMAGVRDYVRGAIAQVYSEERPEKLQARGIEIVQAAAELTDAHTIRAGERVLKAAKVVLATGARPSIPPIPGLSEVPFVTYETFFDNDTLPAHLIVLGAGPIGLEMAQAYRRLGAEVTVVGEELLPREEPEARRLVEAVLQEESIRCLTEKVTGARCDGGRIVLSTSSGEVSGDMLLVATGRRPNVSGLGLDAAGVAHDAKGIKVDDCLRTSAENIYAAGDCTGGLQFTHFAGWQCFQAVRNALLVGNARGFSEVVPAVTFVDPEIAHVGPLEAEARARLGDDVAIHLWEMHTSDRAVCDGETRGFIKLVARKNGRLLGATVAASRAGEMINELALAVHKKLTVTDLAAVIHAYPTWSTPLQQLASQAAVTQFLGGATAKLALGLSRWMR